MSDIATFFNGESLTADLAVLDGDLATEDGLTTAVILSLFTDARADEDDILPAGQTDKRGWWADLLSDDETDKIGSKLWLLEREKVQPSVLRRAEDYARESLNWLLEDQIVTQIDVEAFEAMPRVPGRGSILGLSIVIYRPDQPALDFKFDNLWEATANAI